MDEMIRTENLTKQYKDVRAVSDLSLNVRKGEIYGFLGLNGSGKTTTIRMLLGLIQPTSGAAYMNGQRVYVGNTSLWQQVGFLVEMPYSYSNLTVRENLEIVRRLRLIPEKNAIDKIMDKLLLTPYKNRLAKNLSLGNAQRLGLAKALIHNPKILLLDEPTNGLDPAGIFEIREMLRDLATRHGITIFVSSHILGEVSRFASRIGIIHEGKLIQEVDSDQIEKLCHKHLVIGVKDLIKACEILNQNGYKVNDTAENIIKLSDEDAINNPDDVNTALVKAGCSPTLLKVEEEDLESYFFKTIGIKGGTK